MVMKSTPINMLLAAVDESFDGRAWHGPTLRGSLRGVTEQTAAWRPAPDRHSIWELVVHAAYWKYAVRARLTGAKRGSFALDGSNWFARPISGRRWADDVRLLGDEHRLLRRAIASLPVRALDRRLRGKRDTAAYMLRGIAAHDVYHAGQIQLLKRLMKSAQNGSEPGSLPRP
jgi:DinB superfamily